MIDIDYADEAALKDERPLYEKLVTWIDEDSPGVLYVRVGVRLDARSRAERLARAAFAPDSTLDLCYCVEMNLAAERRVLVDRIHTMYRRHPIHTALTAARLAAIPDDQLRAAFAPIAAQGASIFRRLFQPDRFESHTDEDAPILRAALRSALSREQILVIKSPEPLFPWAFLYDGAFDELDLRTLDLGHFWGFHHQIQEEVDGVSRHVRISAPPAVVAAVCPAVDRAGEHRNGPLGKLAEDRITWVDSVVALEKKLGAFDADCLYFFGHAAQDDPPIPTTSYLTVNGLPLTVERVARENGPRFTKPLVLAFLNGCGTGPLNTWNRDSVAGFLCFAGNRRVACVTTFAEVPAAFASALAQRFWTGFLAGRMLGESLRDARRALLAEYNNPLGLLYTVLGRVETRITREESTSR